MSDADGDSTMHDSSPDFDDSEEMFPDADAPSTPRHLPIQSSSELSPPNSQGPSARDRTNPSGALPLPSPLTDLLNSSRKRARTDTENGTNEARTQLNTESGLSGSEQSGRAASGYIWSKEEDEPGYAWKNKKAQEDFQRAMDAIIEKDRMILTKYGDVLSARTTRT